jgi:hypothetical protein
VGQVNLQGEVYPHPTATHYRMVIVSSNGFNELFAPWACPLQRGGERGSDPYLVALADVDPVGGFVDVGRLTRLRPTGASVGMLTGATMHRVRDAIHTVFSG